MRRKARLVFVVNHFVADIEKFTFSEGEPLDDPTEFLVLCKVLCAATGNGVSVIVHQVAQAAT